MTYLTIFHGVLFTITHNILGGKPARNSKFVLFVSLPSSASNNCLTTANNSRTVFCLRNFRTTCLPVDNFKRNYLFLNDPIHQEKKN